MKIGHLVSKAKQNLHFLKYFLLKSLLYKDYYLDKCNEIKVIINDATDIQFAKDIKGKVTRIKQQTNTHKNKKFFVQPAWDSRKGYRLAINFAKLNPEWTLSLQTHKYLSIQ